MKIVLRYHKDSEEVAFEKNSRSHICENSIIRQKETNRVFSLRSKTSITREVKPRSDKFSTEKYKAEHSLIFANSPYYGYFNSCRIAESKRLLFQRKTSLKNDEHLEFLNFELHVKTVHSRSLQQHITPYCTDSDSRQQTLNENWNLATRPRVLEKTNFENEVLSGGRKLKRKIIDFFSTSLELCEKLLNHSALKKLTTSLENLHFRKPQINGKIP